MLGEKLRQARLAKGLSLMEVATQVGLSAGFLSQIERDLANPSVGSLREICRVLEVPLFHLFLNEEPKRHVVRRDERRVVPLGNEPTVKYERLSPIGPQFKLEMLLMTLAAGQANQERFVSHPGEEIAFCLHGTFRVEVEGQPSVVLEAGDTIYLDSTQPHRYVNIGTCQGQMLFVATQPGY